MHLALIILTASTVSASFVNAAPQGSRLRSRNQVNLVNRSIGSEIGKVVEMVALDTEKPILIETLNALEAETEAVTAEVAGGAGGNSKSALEDLMNRLGASTANIGALRPGSLAEMEQSRKMLADTDFYVRSKAEEGFLDIVWDKLTMNEKASLQEAFKNRHEDDDFLEAWWYSLDSYKRRMLVAKTVIAGGTIGAVGGLTYALYEKETQTDD